MPVLENIKKFISEHGFGTYATAHEERTRREINALYSQDKADMQSFVQDQKASGIAQINARVATVAPMVNVKTEANVNYIYFNQADWTEGETYILPDPDPETGDEMSVVYNSTCLYIGGKMD